MANKKLPDTAFAYYCNLGLTRSYEEVAKYFGCSKRAVVNRAVKEKWQELVEVFDQEARKAAEEKAREEQEAMNLRHLQIAKAIQTKAIEALKRLQFDKPSDFLKAAEISIKLERLIRGEPTDRTEVSTEKKIEEEYARWMHRNGSQGQVDEEIQLEGGEIE